jgi:hypothetical protein
LLAARNRNSFEKLIGERSFIISKYANIEKNAVIRFETGPASATKAKSLRGFLRLRIFTGTGLAHPILKNIIQSAPIGSRCLRGFNVRRPRLLAVESPSL